MTRNAATEEADDLLGDFLDEARQLLARLNENLMLLDRAAAEVAAEEPIACDAAVMNEMFRAAHSIKGLSGMLGFVHINQLTHKIENVFDAARKHELPVTANVVDVVLQACGRLEDLVNALGDSANEEVACDDVIALIAELLQSAGAERSATNQRDAEAALAAALASAQGAATAQPADRNVAPWLSAAIDHFDGLADEQASAKYLAIFIDEAELSLDSMTEVLLAEAGHPRAATETLLITSHRIKGSAASIGLHRPAKLAHFIEDILQDLRQRGEGLTAALTDSVLRCIDALRTYVQQLRDGTPDSSQFGLLANELLAAHAGQPRAAETAPRARSQPQGDAGPVTPAKFAEIARLAPPSGASFVGCVKFDVGLMLAGLKARLLYEKLSQCGIVFYCDPEADRLDENDSLPSFTFAVATNANAAELLATLRIAGVANVQLLPIAPASAASPARAQKPDASSRAAPPSTADAAGNASVKAAEQNASAESSTAGPRDPSKPVETLRVDIDRLDQLMNLAGQLVINKSRFSRIGDQFRLAMPTKQTAQIAENLRTALARVGGECRGAGDAKNADRELLNLQAQLRRMAADAETVHREMQRVEQLRHSIADLGDAVHQLGRVADGIQKSVMDTRMVPIGPLFTRFKRVVRDITRANQKQIELVTRGEKTELDKRMIDELGDPLIHMVRNSADHGVEPPAQRLAAGKPAQGVVVLEACHRGNSIVIQVSDDGKGLDPAYLRRKAIEKGIVSESDAERLTESESFALIWEPGFSTAEKVTEISGRGMGMDIVRAKIEQLNGSVELTSRKGEGTTFTIRLPLTLAILPSLLLRIDGDVFAVPLDAVVEIVTIEPQDLRTVHRRETARVRDRIVSVVRLKELFVWRRDAEPPAAAADDGRITLVVVVAEGREIGVVVDQPLGEEDVVIKSMAENFRNVPGIAGASILGDGRVSLILDPSALLEMASRRTCPTAAN